MGRISAAVVLSIGLALGAIVFASGTLRAGQAAPDIQLAKSDGTLVSLADHRGKVVLVDFWASWCPQCRASFPAIDALYDELHDRGLDVIAIDVDEHLEAGIKFLADNKHSIDVVFDRTGASPIAYGVDGIPAVFLIDRHGRVRFAQEGYEPSDTRVYRREIAKLLAEPTSR